MLLVFPPFRVFDLIHELGDIGKGEYRLRHRSDLRAVRARTRLRTHADRRADWGKSPPRDNWAAHLEVMVMWVSGLRRCARSAGVAHRVEAFVAVTLVFGEYRAGCGSVVAQAFAPEGASPVIAQEFLPGLGSKDDLRFVNVREVRLNTQPGRYHHLRIRFRTNSTGRRSAGPRKAIPAGYGDWRLSRGVTCTLLGAKDGPRASRRRPSTKWKSNLNPDISASLVQPDKMSIDKL